LQIENIAAHLRKKERKTADFFSCAFLAAVIFSPDKTDIPVGKKKERGRRRRREIKEIS
jgi:hypothetical protein